MKQFLALAVLCAILAAVVADDSETAKVCKGEQDSKLEKISKEYEECIKKAPESMNKCFSDNGVTKTLDKMKTLWCNEKVATCFKDTMAKLSEDDKKKVAEIEVRKKLNK